MVVQCQVDAVNRNVPVTKPFLNKLKGMFGVMDFIFPMK